MLVRNLVFNKTNVPLLNKVLNVSSARHRAISNNIANANTVNYARKEVNFADYLRAQVNKPPVVGRKTDGRHMPVGLPDPVAGPASTNPIQDPTRPESTTSTSTRKWPISPRTTSSITSEAISSARNSVDSERRFQVRSQADRS